MKKNGLIIFIFFTQIHNAMEAPLTQTQLNQLAIVVSTQNKANIHVLLDANANVLDLKAKVEALEHISAQQQTIYLIKTKLKIFQTRSKAISDIQKLKDIIDLYNTNKFFVCIAKPKK